MGILHAGNQSVILVVGLQIATGNLLLIQKTDFRINGMEWVKLLLSYIYITV